MSEPTRRWLPADWLDEMNPLLDSREAFIQRDGDGWLLALPEDDPESENEAYRLAVEPGQIVQFVWCDSYDDRVLTVRHDGSWVTDFAIPEGAKMIHHPGTGTIADSMADLLADAREYGDPIKPGDHAIQCYTWSDPLPFRFDVNDGEGRFIACAGVH